MTNQEVIQQVPSGLIAPDLTSRLSAWYFEIDHEHLAHEARQLPLIPGSGPIIRAIRSSAVVEDASVRYIGFSRATSAISPTRQSHLDTSWLPQELTHGTIDHEVIDALEQREVSARDQRNEAASQRISFGKHALDFVIKHVYGKLEPQKLATFVEVKGVANEANPEFLYMAVRDFCRLAKLQTLATVFDVQQKEEKIHGRNYWEASRQRLDELPQLQKVCAFVMRHHARIVGYELLSLEETLNLANLFDPHNSHHLAFMNSRDNRFEKLPGMAGIRPLQASLQSYRPHEELRIV